MLFLPVILTLFCYIFFFVQDDADHFPIWWEFLCVGVHYNPVSPRQKSFSFIFIMLFFLHISIALIIYSCAFRFALHKCPAHFVHRLFSVHAVRSESITIFDHCRNDTMSMRQALCHSTFAFLIHYKKNENKKSWSFVQQ